MGQAIPYSEMTASQSSTDYNTAKSGPSKPLTAFSVNCCMGNEEGTCSQTRQPAQDSEVIAGRRAFWKVTLSRVWYVHSLRLTNLAHSYGAGLEVDIYLDDTRCAAGVDVDIGGTLTVPCVGTASEIRLEKLVSVETSDRLPLCGFIAYGLQGIAKACTFCLF
jgi:hypothetical protein